MRGSVNSVGSSPLAACCCPPQTQKGGGAGHSSSFACFDVRQAETYGENR